MRVLCPPARTNPYRGAGVVILCQSSLEVAFAAGFLDQPHAVDLDVVRERLAHVIDGQGSPRRARQRFNLSAGAMVDGTAATDEKPCRTSSSTSIEQL